MGPLVHATADQIALGVLSPQKRRTRCARTAPEQRPSIMIHEELIGRLSKYFVQVTVVVLDTLEELSSMLAKKKTNLSEVTR